MERKYSEINLKKSDRELFNSIANQPSHNSKEIIINFTKLSQSAGYSAALIALFRQQVNCGFVLKDPKITDNKKFKSIFDASTGVEFAVQWNPDRELRKNHKLLIDRGVIADNFDKNLLINKDNDHKPCYLCRENIELQNPLEILVEIQLAEKNYNIGANFAPISDNHFTLMSSVHKAQIYKSKIVESALDFVDITDGVFKTIFNGQAGASILSHLHMQATTDKFPIENIIVSKHDVVFENGNTKVFKPNYYIPTIIVEGKNKSGVNEFSNKIILKWKEINPHNTINVLIIKNGDLYKAFICLRDRTKLAGENKNGAMGTFECAGNLVLSYGILNNNESGYDERDLFENISLEMIKELLNDINPKEKINLKEIFN